MYPGYPTAAAAAAASAGVSAALGKMAQSKDGYGQTLAVLRNQAEAAPGGAVPWWNFFNAMPYVPLQLTAAHHSRVAISTAAAYSCRGVAMLQVRRRAF
eukprot:SAG11_NODE_840_length_6909_cov_27.081057_4_plen_99_part_00